ncbi:hypothetical protein SAMN02745753_03914 [Marinomonas polaris DSM 16579]|uniref:P pilus assembly protein, chaperone PapD n=3 Tax=Marinomonas TaxID=28253 RepID=A0A1M5JPF6_9GAMM|nr:hypothetical protein SAMN02745753_03914 [Marinomonas polaris DSM 16579]
MYYFIKIFLFMLLFIISPIYAIEVSPMVITFSPFETSKIPSSMIYNDLSRDVAFEVQVYEVKFDPLGLSEPDLIPLEDSPLWVFPPLLYLKSGKNQRIQFRWLGETVPKTDKTYQVSLIEQSVANEPEEKQSKLTVLLNINLIVHIDQLKMLPNLNIENTHLEQNSIVAKVVNSGDGSSRLSDYDMSIFYNGVKKETYYKDQLKSQGYDVFFPPLSSMFIRIPLAFSVDNLNSKKMHIELFK